VTDICSRVADLLAEGIMRPHTRTHCSRKGDCEGEPRHTRNLQRRDAVDPAGGGLPGRAGRTDGGFGGPEEIPPFTSGGTGPAAATCRHISLVELPAEIIVKILEYMTFRENATVRLVSGATFFFILDPTLHTTGFVTDPVAGIPVDPNYF
jgi:hypothetical protein